MTVLAKEQMKNLSTRRLLAYFKKARKSYQIWSRTVDPEAFFGMQLCTLVEIIAHAKAELSTRENVPRKGK